jgi:tRNA-dihydrouridine synthase
MIGRAALGNPWIYKSVAAILEGGEERNKPTFEEYKQAALKHLKLEIETEGEKIGCLKSRRIMCWYFKDYPGINVFRDRINRSNSPSEIRKIVEDFVPSSVPSSPAVMSLQAVAVPVGQASIVLLYEKSIGEIFSL